MTALIFALALFLAAPPQTQTPADGIDPRRRTPVVEVFEATRDSVVNIASTQVIELRSPFGFDNFFDFGFDLYENRRRRRIRQTSVGSGFVLHPAGYIVTNAHVVARTAERRAIFADGSEFDAEIVAVDEPHDLAVLKIDPNAGSDRSEGAGARPRELKPIPLGTSSDLMVGETVIAIGNPLGYQHTVTAGVVSATQRELPVDEETSLTGLIQTDASINPGNSGGPLLNILGQLVGINTAIRADAQNIGFAIPVDQLRELLPVMLDVERRYRIHIGATVSPGSPARVTQVEPGSPAEAVLRVGDVITAVEGQPVVSGIDYYIALIGRQPGPLRLTVGEREATLQITERPRPDGAKLLLTRFGLEAEPLDAERARQLGVPRLRGLIVTGIQLNSPAEAAGLEPGDVLIQVGRHQPTDLDEVGELLEDVAAGDQVDVGVIRVGRNTIYRAVTRLRAR